MTHATPSHFTYRRAFVLTSPLLPEIKAKYIFEMTGEVRSRKGTM